MPNTSGATNGKGVDVILDIIGAAVLDKEIDCLADEGRLVLIAYLGGRLGTVDLAQIVHRQLMVTGSTLRPRSNEFKAEIARNLQKHIWPLIDEGKIKPVIYKVFPLAERDAGTETDAVEYPTSGKSSCKSSERLHLG